MLLILLSVKHDCGCGGPQVRQTPASLESEIREAQFTYLLFCLYLTWTRLGVRNFLRYLQCCSSGLLYLCTSSWFREILRLLI